MEMEMEMEKKNVKMNLGRPVIELKLPNSTNNIPSKSPIEGFKTDIVLSPFSAISPRPLMIGNNSAIRNDFQSNMNGTIFQNQRFSAYLESINQIGQSNITSPMAQPLHTNYKSTISEYRSQLHHHSDMNRVTFPSIVEAYEEESQRDRKLNQVTEEELKAWLSTATPEEIFNNMHRIIGVPKKMFLKNSKSMEVFKKSPDYPVLGMDQYMYKEPKVFTPLYVKYKNMNVTIYIKNSDFHCTAGKEKISKLNIFPFPLHIAVGVSYNENVLNVHIVVQNTKRDYCIKTVSFITASETIALTYSDILFQNIYYDEDSILRTSFVQIYIDSNNEELRNFINRWFRVPFELANCNYEIITDISQISIAAQVFIFMTRKEDVCKNIEKINKWEESMAIVHQTIYGHPLQVIMAALKERFYERWLLEYNDWKKYK
ncbi:hypothetical protein LY90DRAFT_674811 [Neocallimastix californiae]|uniref:Uncharacterized protein n=1 Tax=Neocallimastix californiae TaxID=1754190 RepID=A0A1Y2ATN7_9FUNG|nr:hypothetical protein LY90DRAFT_674811 [Neocallimastix californiae]|eukprot:ORY25577.1 hypothetical protein LY90DRAFT_674811 [Neocallimastix californiae]